MRIDVDHIKNTGVKIQEIENGEMFYYKGRYYIKIDDRETEYRKWYQVERGVDVTTGKIYTYKEDVRVDPVCARVVIE